MSQSENKAHHLLFIRFCKGEKHVFKDLYEYYKTPVYRYIRRSVFKTEIADELFQDVWLKLVASSSRYQEEGQFRSWLFACAHNVVVDHV